MTRSTQRRRWAVLGPVALLGAATAVGAPLVVGAGGPGTDVVVGDGVTVTAPQQVPPTAEAAVGEVPGPTAPLATAPPLTAPPQTAPPVADLQAPAPAPAPVPPPAPLRLASADSVASADSPD